jgi:hypothetical protein
LTNMGSSADGSTGNGTLEFADAVPFIWGWTCKVETHKRLRRTRDSDICVCAYGFLWIVFLFIRKNLLSAVWTVTNESSSMWILHENCNWVRRKTYNVVSIVSCQDLTTVRSSSTLIRTTSLESTQGRLSEEHKAQDSNSAQLRMTLTYKWLAVIMLRRRESRFWIPQGQCRLYHVMLLILVTMDDVIIWGGQQYCYN